MNSKLANALAYFEKQAVGANVRRMMQLSKARGTPLTAPAARQAAMYSGGAPVAQPSAQLQDLASQARSLNAGPGMPMTPVRLGQDYRWAAGTAPVMPTRWKQLKAIFEPQGTGMYQQPVIPDTWDSFFSTPTPPKTQTLFGRVGSFLSGQPAEEFREKTRQHLNDLAYRREQDRSRSGHQALQSQRAQSQLQLADRRPQLQHTGKVPDFYEGPEPTSLYKGYESSAGSMTPRVYSRQGSSTIASAEELAGRPAWYSGHPEISADYASKGDHGLMLQRPLAAVKQDGPVGPFTRHTMVDTRETKDISRVPIYNSNARMAGLSAEAETPYYERVGTFPASPRDLLKGSKVWRPHPTIPNQMYQAADFSKFSSSLEYFEKQALGANTKRLMRLAQQVGQQLTPQQARHGLHWNAGFDVQPPTKLVEQLAAKSQGSVDSSPALSKLQQLAIQFDKSRSASRQAKAAIPRYTDTHGDHIDYYADQISNMEETLKWRAEHIRNEEVRRGKTLPWYHPNSHHINPNWQPQLSAVEWLQRLAGLGGPKLKAKIEAQRVASNAQFMARNEDSILQAVEYDARDLQRTLAGKKADLQRVTDLRQSYLNTTDAYNRQLAAEAAAEQRYSQAEKLNVRKSWLRPKADPHDFSIPDLSFPALPIPRNKKPEINFYSRVSSDTPQPNHSLLFKGVNTEPRSYVPRPGVVRGTTEAAAGNPIWYSGFPEISAGYGDANTMLEVPQSSVAAMGPLSLPSRHVMKDTRGMTQAQLDVLNANTVKYDSPVGYESVGTMPSDPRKLLTNAKIWKRVPDQTGRVNHKLMYLAADASKIPYAPTKKANDEEADVSGGQAAGVGSRLMGAGSRVLSFVTPALAELAGGLGLGYSARKVVNLVAPGLMGGSAGFTGDERDINKAVSDRLHRIAARNKTMVTADQHIPLSESKYVPELGAFVGTKDTNDYYSPDAGVLAHELGHATQGFKGSQKGKLSGNRQLGFLPSLSRLSTAVRSRPQLAAPIMAVGGLTSQFSADEPTAAAGAAVASALPLLNVVNEYDAGQRGDKLMSAAMRGVAKYNLPGMQEYARKVKYRTYGGLPTYLAAAAVPAIPYLTRKLRGDFNQPEIKQAGILQSGGKLSTRELLQRMFRLQNPVTQGQVAPYIPAAVPMNRRSFLGEIAQQAADKYAPKLQQDIATVGKYHELGNKIPQALKYFQQQKTASTALVRNIRKGLVSVPNIQRAAAAMKPDSFRNITIHGNGPNSLNALGSGQFNLADVVVGNIKRNMGAEPWTASPGTAPLTRLEQLKAKYLPSMLHTPRTVMPPGKQSDLVSGLMVHKLPTRYDYLKSTHEPYLANSGMQKRFLDEAEYSKGLNQLHTDQGQVPPISPTIAVNHRGSFSRVGNLKPDQMNADQMVSSYGLQDVHDGNVGLRGQIFDYLAPGKQLDWHLPLISPETAELSRTSGVVSPEFWGRDTLGNLSTELPEVTKARGQEMLLAANRKNNDIRRFWNSSDQRGVVDGITNRLKAEHTERARKSYEQTQRSRSAVASQIPARQHVPGTTGLTALNELNPELADHLALAAQYLKGYPKVGIGPKRPPIERLELAKPPVINNYFEQNTPLATNWL